MNDEIFNIRPATKKDVPILAVLINQAGEGLPLVVWKGLAKEGQHPRLVGRERVAREDTGVSYTNAFIAEIDGVVAGCLIGYTEPDEAEPVDDDTPAMFRPLQELENEAVGTGYVYVLSTLPGYQGRGFGAKLLEFAERFRGPNGMSLIVSDANTGARRLYERCGYREASRRAMVKKGWENPGENWVLMLKP